MSCQIWTSIFILTYFFSAKLHQWNAFSWKIRRLYFGPVNWGCFEKIENFREKRYRAKPIPLFEKFRDFSRKPVQNTGLNILWGVLCGFWFFSYGFLLFSYGLWTLSNFSCDNIKRNITGFYFFTSFAFLMFFNEETTISQSKKLKPWFIFLWKK